VLLGAGDGRFVAGVDLPAGDNVGVVGAADANGDGRLDVLLRNTDGLWVLLGAGNGGFAAPSLVFGSPTPVSASWLQTQRRWAR
jgi:hypothetical protein